MGAESPDLVTAKRLLDDLKLRGFACRRTAPGEDAPLVGNRASQLPDRRPIPPQLSAAEAVPSLPGVCVPPCSDSDAITDSRD